ncbi:outer membrane beta-barrel protein [Colwellia sp. BRX8-4]|uniref:OmpW/AlkL family protein n=1 Tax=Colwellia sp. BRX8-4 TaxID=2759836 RepID=UPI0015F6C9B7|nr:OmpW family outer membrane protein [Colwellia sp. BRX8-4]MBA6364038.1 outer membrane beta-barrel protein [Colwellia sp. BRX8-8]MBA6370150.1 outer membrane beta-barrel protein [Colwellia sp. BRX8-4]
MKKRLLTLAVLASLSVTAFAEDYKAGDFVFRGGVTMVNPDSGKSGVFVEALGGNTPLSLSVDDNTQLGLNFIYFYDNNWAIEVLAATPFAHDVIIHDQQRISAGLFGANVDGATLAEVTQLPPTISALYYFNSASNIKPYVGVGINYTIFFDESFKSTPESLGFNDLELDGSLGLSFQVGADYLINDKWHVNASARYIDINADATFKIGDIKGSASVEIDPMVYSIMLGYKF